MSEVARSRPWPSPSVPLQMLPPPTITASSRSSDLRASAISFASRSSTVGVDRLVGGRRGERLARHLHHEPATPATVNVYAGSQVRPRPPRTPQAPDDDLCEADDLRFAEQVCDRLLLILDERLLEQDTAP